MRGWGPCGSGSIPGSPTESMKTSSSHREIEAKILDINLEEVKSKLHQLKGILERETDLSQVIWWIKNSKVSIRVRERSDGVIRLTMKDKVKDGLGYNEWEIDVSEYEKTIAIIDRILPEPGLRIDFSHHREDWNLGGVLISLNSVPKINPFIEIEAESEERVKETANLLGLDTSALIDKGIVQIIIERLNLKQSRIKL